VRIEVANLRTEMKEQKVEIVKWMFSLLMGQTVLILGVVYFLIRTLV